MVARRELRWEMAEALDLLCADKSAPTEDLENMIAAARAAGVAESKLQEAMAQAAQRRGSHTDAPSQLRGTGSLIARQELRWEMAQALDLLCADKSALKDDLENMIAAARAAGVAESKLQEAMAEAEQRRESHADAPTSQTCISILDTVKHRVWLETRSVVRT